MRSSALPETCCPGDPATLWVGPGGIAAYIGPSLRLAPHSGSVACFVVGVDAPFRLRASGRERLVRSALVPARTVHHVVAGPGRMLFAYLEPGSARARRLQQRMTDRTDAVLVAHGAESGLLRRIARADHVDLAALVAGIAPDDATPVMDARIRLALRIVQDRPQEITAATLAAELGLSPSWLLHLFSAQVGTSFRRYRLWARILLVIGALSRGSELTTAAVDAGFASSSHLSDTVRRMFGLTITRLLAGRPSLIVTVEDTPGCTSEAAGRSGRPR